MKCKKCIHGIFDHHVDGSPNAVYTCGHPHGLTDDGNCRFDKPKIRFCWDCGRQLRGNHCEILKIDGYDRVLHKQCAKTLMTELER